MNLVDLGRQLVTHVSEQVTVHPAQPAQSLFHLREPRSGQVRGERIERDQTADGMQLQPWVERGGRIDAERSERCPVLLPERNEILSVLQALWIDAVTRKDARMK